MAMTPHLSLVTQEQIRTARLMVREHLARDGRIDRDEEVVLAVIDDAVATAEATCAAVALAHAVERGAATGWYVDRLYAHYRETVDELPETAA